MADETPAGAAHDATAGAFTGDSDTGAPSAPAPRPEPAPPREAPRLALAASDGFDEAAAEGEPAAPVAEAPGTGRDANGRFAPKLTPRRERHNQIHAEIDELVQARERTRAELAAARQELEALQSRRGPAAGTPPAAAEPEPTLESYLAQGKPYEEWIKAWNRWDRRQELDQRFSQVEQRQQAERAQHAETQASTAFAERVAAFQQEHPDYLDVVTREDLPRVSRPIMQVIRHEPVGPALAYYLAQHPDELTTLTNLGDTAPAYVALGRLTAKLETPNNGNATGAVSRAPLTKAHPPLTPVTGAGTTATRADDLEFGAEYIRRMNTEEKRRSGR